MSMQTMKALGLALAAQLIDTMAAAIMSNAEMIRAALIEALTDDPTNALQAFEACDAELEAKGFRTISEQDRSRARRIAKGANSTPELLAEVLAALQAGQWLQTVAALCPTVTKGGRPKSSAKTKDGGKADAADAPTGAHAGKITEGAVRDWLMQVATPAEVLAVMRHAVAASAERAVLAKEPREALAKMQVLAAEVK